MRSKAPLVMMEQLVMVLVFALTAALCMQMFVFASSLSEKYEATDKAVREAQNLAEAMKYLGFEECMKERGCVQMTEHSWTGYYNADWEPADTKDIYYMEIFHEKSEWLWKAEIVIYFKDGTELFRIPVTGQTDTEVE